MSTIVTPSTIATSIDDLVFTNFNYEKASSKYEQNETKFISLLGVKFQKKNIKVSIVGELGANGLLVSEFDGKKNFSLLVSPEESDDADAIEKIGDKLTSLLQDADDPEDYSFSSFVKDEKFFLKLKLGADKKSFVVKNNLKLNPNKIDNTGLYHGQRVTVVGDLGAYVNLRDKKYGLTFTPRKIDFEVDFDEPAPKKQKK